MAEDVLILNAPSLGPALANVPPLDGVADQMSTPQRQSSTTQASRLLQDIQDGPIDNDTMMISPTRATITGAAPPTPAASPRIAVRPAGPVPLDSPLRTKSIHPSLEAVKVPDASPNAHPVTLQPFTDAELAKYGYEKLRAQIFTAADKRGSSNTLANITAGTGLSEREKEEIVRMRDETAAVLKHKIEEKEAKVREIDREMEEKEKIREVERKVFRKKLAGGKDV